MSRHRRKLLAARFARLAIPILSLVAVSCRREPENEVTTDVEKRHPPYFHDGSAKSLSDVVEHYVRVRRRGTT